MIGQVGHRLVKAREIHGQRIAPYYLEMFVLLLQFLETGDELAVLFHRHDLSGSFQQQLRQIADSSPDLQHRIPGRNVGASYFAAQDGVVGEEVLAELFLGADGVGGCEGVAFPNALETARPQLPPYTRCRLR